MCLLERARQRELLFVYQFFIETRLFTALDVLGQNSYLYSVCSAYNSTSVCSGCKQAIYIWDRFCSSFLHSDDTCPTCLMGKYWSRMVGLFLNWGLKPFSTNDQTKKLVESSFPYVVLGVLYLYLLFLSWSPETLPSMFASKYWLPEVLRVLELLSNKVETMLKHLAYKTNVMCLYSYLVSQECSPAHWQSLQHGFICLQSTSSLAGMF